MNELFEAALASSLEELPAGRVREAMNYALLAPGKRIRPRLLFAALEDYGLDPAIGMPTAIALEMVHTYSLIHDDLPAMDDDDLRRGRPTVHKAFDEATAILAGDGLLSEAFYQLSAQETRMLAPLVIELSTASGAGGMIYGQELDLFSENPDFEELKRIQLNKTGQLLAFPLVAAAIIANRPQDLEQLRMLGLYLGLAFQIQDDLLDLQGNEQLAGKSLSDAAHGKKTMATLLGEARARSLLEQIFKKTDDLAAKLSFQPQRLSQLIEDIQKRKH